MELTCSICIRLRDAFGSDKPYHRDRLPPLNEILDDSCPGHNPLFRYIEGQLATGSRCMRPYLSKSVDNCYLRVAFWDSKDIDQFQFIVVEGRDTIWPSHHGRILDPNWIDVGLITEWMERCATLHGGVCSNPLRIAPASPDWLIDTLNACIVPGHGITDYVAMSYRWGASKGFRIGTDNFEFAMIRKPGALAEANIADKIPLSIAHAMKLVHSIGERYLWVDAMCIDQRDEVHLGRQLNMMGAIYASAKLSIIATDGDATSGIRGLKGISLSRDLEVVALPLFENSTVIRTETVSFTGRNIYIKGDSEYFRRGWTHQEFYLSKRRLIFYGGRIFWQCTCEDWYEDLIEQIPPRTKDRAYSFQSSIMLKGVPDLRELNTILRDYSCREHTHPEDSLPAITGLLSILSRSFEGGFLCGLPEACFDAALMWYTQKRSQRRLRSSSNNSRSELISLLPSWSWIGWQTEDLTMATGENLTLRTRFHRTTPITQWFTHESPHSGPKRRIQPTWFSFRESLKTPLSSLPPGWAKKTIKGEGPRGLDEGYAYFPSEFPNDTYWLPFPIAQSCEDRVPWSPPQTSFISCRTKLGRFQAMRGGEDVGEDTMVIGDRIPNWGRLYPHTKIDTLLPTHKDVLMVELVAICLQEMGDIIMDPARRWKRVYGVLWVEWVDGVAYRQGSGFVHAVRWEQHDCEDVDLVLG